MRRPRQPGDPEDPAAAAPIVPAVLPRARVQEPSATDPADPAADDLERGRTVALVAALGRVQLSLDLIDRRLGRFEELLKDIQETQARLEGRAGSS